MPATTSPKSSKKSRESRKTAAKPAARASNAPTKKVKKAAKGASAHYLKELRFKREHRVFKRGRTLAFRPGVNLLVGEQGTGKSTVLELVHGLGDKWESERTRKVVEVTTEACRILRFDFEHDSPRTKSYFDESFTQVQFQLKARFSSHGETVNELLRQLAATVAKRKGQENVLVLLDEPDMALSPRSAHKLARLLDELAANGAQVVAAVHNPIVVASQDEVFSLEHKKWMKSAKFLEDHAAV